MRPGSSRAMSILVQQSLIFLASRSVDKEHFRNGLGVGFPVDYMFCGKGFQSLLSRPGGKRFLRDVHHESLLCDFRKRVIVVRVAEESFDDGMGIAFTQARNLFGA